MGDIRQEWEDLKERDVLFVLEVVASRHSDEGSNSHNGEVPRALRFQASSHLTFQHSLPIRNDKFVEYADVRSLLLKTRPGRSSTSRTPLLLVIPARSSLLSTVRSSRKT